MMINVDMKKLGNKIKYYRTLNGMTQKELADASYISRSQIASHEQGRGISIPVLVSLCSVLRITVEEILEDTYVSDIDSNHRSIDYLIVRELNDCDLEMKHKILKMIKFLKS